MGINMNYNASKLVKLEVISYMILRENKGDETTVVNVHTEKKMKRKRKGGTISIVTDPEDKIHRISFFKRRRLGENISVPFGFK